LKPFALAHGSVNIAHKQDHWLGILHRNMHANAGVGCAWTARYKADPRPACHCAVSAGHEGRAAFLPTSDKVDLGQFMQSIENRQKALARNGEYPITALGEQALSEDLRSGLRRSKRGFLSVHDVYR
jgi:hypothetical protein